MYYSLQLADGSTISNLQRINPSTFELKSTDGGIYHQLNDYNLSFAILLNEDGDMEDVFLGFTMQNFSCQCEITRFRIANKEELEAQLHAKEEKEVEKRRKYNEKMKRRRKRR